MEKIDFDIHFPHPHVLINKDLKNAIDTNYLFQKSFPNVTFIDGRKILKELNYDETVDGTHLTDLGFYFVARFLIDYIK